MERLPFVGAIEDSVLELASEFLKVKIAHAQRLKSSSVFVCGSIPAYSTSRNITDLISSIVRAFVNLLFILDERRNIVTNSKIYCNFVPFLRCRVNVNAPLICLPICLFSLTQISRKVNSNICLVNLSAIPIDAVE